MLFVSNFNINLVASGTLQADAKFQYLLTLVRGEALRQFEFFSADVESTDNLDVDYIIRSLAQYFFLVNSLSKHKHTMRCGMKNLCSLTVRCYVSRLIDLNKYLASFPGATFTDEICVTELNRILLKSMPNICSKQVYV